MRGRPTITLTMSLLRVAALAAAAGLAPGCLDSYEPDVGAPLRPLCSDEDSDLEVDVSFRDDIEAGLLARTDLACIDCHSGGGLAIGFRVSGLNLSSYALLRRGGIASGEAIVLPGRPCESILVQKVGQAPPFGARMPINGPPFMTADEVQLLSDWIAEGADDD
ncbi:MAG TPA: hypothetical protein VEL05_03155 [Candidatus Acidoferrum sp.]|nr:hypothetical protein [Candidatus Acidoferrum sp.]